MAAQGSPSNYGGRKLAADRLREFISTPSDTCQLWTESMTKCGYGRVRFEGEAVKTHRVAYYLTHGEMPAGGVVRHTCDVRSCVNPAHLIGGTQRDNMHDMRRRTRPGGTLTEDDVFYIETRPESVRNVDLAREFGVSPTHISHIRREGKDIT